MKSIFKICLIAVIVFTAGNVNAQNLKFGHVDQRAIIQAMPETAAVQKTFEEEQKALEDQFASLQKEYDVRLNEFNDSSLTTLVKQTKLEDLQSLGQRIQNFTNTAQQKLENRYAELMQPVGEKMNKAIEEVAKEQGLIYVFPVEMILYKSSASIDLLPLVKKKLGL